MREKPSESRSKKMEDLELPECAVCLQSCNHPAKLPCGHIFCFLCAKGVAIQNKRCAMCRQDIPPDYLDHPVLLESNSAAGSCTQPASLTPPAVPPQLFQWYYEGRNGWWMYDERSNTELEASYESGATECQLLLAGALYHVDLRTMLQVRRTDVTRRRRVKRDIPAAPAKGIAGIKMTTSSDSEREKEPGGGDNVDVEEERRGEELAATQEAPDQPDDIIRPPSQFNITDSFRSLSLDEAPAADSIDSNAEQE